MENIISIFVRSIFIDNMVFAFFFGMCSYIAVSKSVKTAMGLGIAVIFVMVMTVPINYLLNEFILSPGALGWINPAYGPGGESEIDLSFVVRAVGRNGGREIRAGIVQSVGNFPAADRGELRDHGRFAVHAGARLRFSGRSYRVRGRFGDRLVAGDHSDGRYPREAVLFEHSRPAARRRDYVHPDRPDGDRLHDVHGDSVVNRKIVK